MKNKYLIIVFVLSLFSTSYSKGKILNINLLTGNQIELQTEITDHYEKSEQEQNPIVIKNVTIIDATGSAAKPDMTVIIKGNLISSIGKNGKLSIPMNAKTIDGTGKFLIPGLWDSHVHLSYAGESVLEHFIYNGVTSVRDMGSNIIDIKNWQSQIQKGILLGPRILSSGPAIESVHFIEGIKKVDEILDIELSDILLPTRLGIVNDTDAKEAVELLVSYGVDYIKVRTVHSSETYHVILAEANRMGKAVVGHDPMIGALDKSLDAGLRCIEHFPFFSLMDLSAQERTEIFEQLRKYNGWITPTIIAAKKFRLQPDSVIYAIIQDRNNEIDKRRKSLPQKMIDFWEMQMKIKVFETSFDWETIIEQGINDLRTLHEMGVPILAGTDFSIPLVYPGYSIHEELELLVNKAGLSPMEAIQSATLNPAKFSNMEHSLGTIEEGKIADIVLLHKNPLENIGNTKDISLIIQGGKIYQKD